MAAAEPSEEDIATVLSFGLCERTTAIKYLKAKKNNVEQAINAIIDSEDVTGAEAANTWDESAWSADRQGTQTEGYSTLKSLGASAAPTRGPSPSGSYRQPGSKAEEDADFAAAMAASQQDLGYGQETGVIKSDGTTQPVYGPQTHDKYHNANEWALVKATPIASEIVPDVEPQNRRYIPREPRFLKCSSGSDYLHSFLTICHSISAARELLLLDDYLRPDYGKDPDWWKGQPIAMPRIVDLSNGNPANPDAMKYDEFVTETQRLIAFLDSSNRAYASISALEQTQLLSSHGKTAISSRTSIIQTFIREFAYTAGLTCGRRSEVERLFCTMADTDAEADSGIEIFDIDVDVNADVTEDQRALLPEILDNLLWEADSDDLEQNDQYINQLPEILVIRAKQQNTSQSRLQLTAPPKLSMDKYLRENAGVSQAVRKDIANHRKRLAKIEEAEKKLKTWPHPKNSSWLDARSLLSHSRAQYIAQTKHIPVTTDDDDESMANGVDESVPTVTSDVVEKLDKIIQSVEDRLTRLADLAEKTRKAISDLSKDPPKELVEKGMKHYYTLVGIGTKPNITYVLRQKQEADDEVMLLEKDDDETPPGMQWWRIEYSVNGTNANVSRTKMAAYEVLPAVALEHHTALLVYASANALEAGSVYQNRLPEPLQDFIEKDNELFDEELRMKPPPQYSFDMSTSSDHDIPRESIERKDSIDSLRAQGAGSPDLEDYPDPAQHSAFGLGYDVKAGYDPPVTIIPEPAEDEGIDPDVVGRPHAGYTPDHRRDYPMADAESQDIGDTNISRLGNDTLEKESR